MADSSADWSAFGGAPSVPTTGPPPVPGAAPATTAPASTDDGGPWAAFGGRPPVKIADEKPPASDINFDPTTGYAYVSKPASAPPSGAAQLDIPTINVHPFAPPAPGALERVGTAAKEGWQGAPAIPMATGAAAIQNPFITAANTLLGGAGAAFRGGQQFLQEAIDPIVPGLGRDVAAIPEAFPFGPKNDLLPYGIPDAPYAQPPPRFVPKTPVTLDDLTAAIQKTDQPAPPPTPAPQGGSVGAAASREQTPASAINLTPEQAAAAGSTADKQWLYKTMQPGVADTTEYLPGISPTMAQREQTVNAALDTKTLRNLSPDAAQAERELLDEHNNIRKNFFQETAGSDVTQQAALKDANDNIDTSLQSAFRNNGTVNPQPIADQISTELASPAGKLPPVQTAMKTLTDALQKSDGTGMETDPRMVYGVRRVINYMQSKKGQLENPGYGDADVMAALQRVKQATDGAIEPAAPGFKQAIADYATARQAIDAKEALQAAEPKLYDNLGRMQYPAMHRFMNDVVQSRDPRAPLNPYQSLTDMQMARLKSIHDDLQRVASASDLAKASGSDTTQSLLSTLRSAAGGLPGTIAASVAGHVFGGPLGAILGGTAKQAISNVVSERAGQRNLAKMGTMLRPDPTQFPTTPNQLMPPP